jgi:hypothetical protein
MFGTKVKTKFNAAKVAQRAKAGSIKSLGHAAAALRLIARRSIRRSPGPSTPGSPPHTRAGQLKRAIMYAVDNTKTLAVIGPDVSLMGKASMAHEFGGRFRGARYPKRAFMGPALEKIRPRLPKMWAKSVK